MTVNWHIPVKLRYRAELLFIYYAEEGCSVFHSLHSYKVSQLIMQGFVQWC